jgi:hypothetical protein
LNIIPKAAIIRREGYQTYSGKFIQQANHKYLFKHTYMYTYTLNITPTAAIIRSVYGGSGKLGRIRVGGLEGDN